MTTPDDLEPPAAMAATGGASFSFEIDVDYDEDGLSIVSGTFDAPDRLMVLVPMSYPAHSLSMHMDAASYDVSDSGWGPVLLPPEEPSDSAATHESLLTLFAPLAGGEPFTGTRTVTIDGTDHDVEYDFPGRNGGKIQTADFVIEISTNPDGGFPWPDPEQLLLTVDDVLGDTANPVFATWFEALEAQKAIQSEQTRLAAEERASASAKEPSTPTTTTAPFAWIDPKDAVGGAILESSTATGYWGESWDTTLAIEPPSDCSALLRFNSHKTAGFERVQSYDNGTYIERNGAYVTYDAAQETSRAGEVAEQCPAIAFEDGRTASTTAVTVGLPDGWSGFILSFDDGTEIYYAFGGRERLISVVRMEYSPLRATDTNREQRLRDYAETAARRLNEAPSR